MLTSHYMQGLHTNFDSGFTQTTAAMFADSLSLKPVQDDI